jgi:hypothetical protein
MGAARESTPSAINKAPAIRFLKTPKGRGIGHPLAGMIILYQESDSWKEDIDVAVEDCRMAGTLIARRVIE